MAINLSNLNISLDKFNSVSSGTYNIGQMKLSSDGKSVYRTNSHKTFTILNRTEISSEEALAVKFAFCKALSQEGLSKDAINTVKQKLGIPGDAMAALKAGNVKPLTAAEVREVIDTYAAQINQNRALAVNGAKALKTSAEIYRGVDKQEMENRTVARDEINAQSAAKLKTTADKAVNNVLSVLHFGGNVEGITPVSKMFAREMLAKLSNPMAFVVKDKEPEPLTMTAVPVTFTLHKNGNILAQITLGNQNTLTIDTGLDKEALVNKATGVLNAIADYNSLRAEPPRIKKDADDDDIMKAINELELGGVETEELETGKVETDKVETSKAKAGSGNAGINKAALLNGLNIVFQELKKSSGQKNLRKLREANMEAVVKALQQALDKARHLDNKNTILINNVREAFYGNPKINIDDLFKEISDVLNKKQPNPMDKVDENIKNKVVDLEETININAYLGEDDA